MSMGQSVVENFIDTNGNKLVNRLPAKVLNPYVKANMLLTLKRSDVFVYEYRNPGSDEYVAKDSAGKTLFKFDNAWDYGYYLITSAKGATLGEMDWYENDGYTNAQQQDIFDILSAMIEKSTETRRIEEGRKKLTPDEVSALQLMGISMGRSV